MPPQALLPRIDTEVLREHASWLVDEHYDPSDGMVKLSIHSWLLRTPHHNILIDACAGNHKIRNRPETADFNQQDTPYLKRLASTGARPEDIDFVMCTHLHVDHVGWNTRLDNGVWVPTFPNAKYLFSEIDYEYWNTDNRVAAEPYANEESFVDSVLPVVTAGQAELISDLHAIEDDVIVRARPGHTPGHTNVELGQDGKDAIFSGDTMHHALQVYYPDLSSGFCELPEQGRQTRRALLERCADQSTIILPAHFGAPHVGRVRSTTQGFAFDFIDP